MTTFRPATAWFAGLVCAGVFVGAGVDAARPAAAECECWRYVRTGDTAAGTTLAGVAAPSPGVAWATGSRGNRPMLMTWTGTRWRETPVRFTAGTLLEGIAATSPRDAWVVGYDDGTPALARWTGRRWVSMPMPAAGPTFPRAVDARTPTDAWIVGSRDGFAGARAGAWHWDGRSWSAAPLADGPGVNSELVAVSAHSGRDAWAVGNGGTTPPRQLLLHWDGKDWTPARAPQPPDESELTDVTMLSGDNVWAVGGTTPATEARPPSRTTAKTVPGRKAPRRLATGRTATGGMASGKTATHRLATGRLATGKIAPGKIATGRTPANYVRRVAGERVVRPVQPPLSGSRPLAEHWDGRAWRVMPIPVIDGEFYSVAGDGASGVWAAGQRADGSALLAHWDGHAWDISRPPTPDGRGPAAVWAITQVRGTSYLWAVGPVDGPMYQALTWTNAPRPR